MHIFKSLLVLFLILSNTSLYAKTKQLLLVANESVIGKPAVIIESAASELEDPEVNIAAKLYVREGDTVGAGSESRQRTGCGLRAGL